MSITFIYCCPWNGLCILSFSSIALVTSCLLLMTMRWLSFSIVWNSSLRFLVFTSFRQMGFLGTLSSVMGLIQCHYAFCLRKCLNFLWSKISWQFIPWLHREYNFAGYQLGFWAFFCFLTFFWHWGFWSVCSWHCW